MSQAVKKCEKGKDPKKCTPEQVRECHGDVKKHPCCGPGKQEGK